MATAEPHSSRPHDRSKGRRPFASWVKRLANLKGSSTSTTDKKLRGTKRQAAGNNNPYPESGFPTIPMPSAPSTMSGGASSFAPASVGSGRVGSYASYDDTTGCSKDIPLRSNKSTAPTLATNAGTINSDAGFSRTGTTYTDGLYSERRANSTFSSPQASQESLTTTLTTIHSTAPSTMLHANAAAATLGPVTFSHQYPISPPASAVPPHLNPHSHPQTYSAATANGLLTDDASIMTLASSTKRRRRNSVDTNASVRAIAPSSVWGNSRESLPLSVLSQTMDREPPALPGSSGAAGAGAGRPSISGLASAERASVYSNPGGVGAPALLSERNSFYSTKAPAAVASASAALDSISVRSGHVGLGHGRSESINGSVTGLSAERAVGQGVSSALAASPRETDMPGRSSTRASRRVEGDVEEERDAEALHSGDLDAARDDALLSRTADKTDKSARKTANGKRGSDRYPSPPLSRTNSGVDP